MVICLHLSGGAAATASVGVRRSSVLNQPEDVAIGVGDGGHQAAATDVARGLLHVAPAAVTSASFASMSGTCE